MASGLVGYTGFVGGNILSGMNFEELYNSRNFEQIRDKEFDLLVFSGARAEKWLANSQPEQDRHHIDLLIENLKTVKAKTFVLISTVDVYKDPKGVSEEDATQYLNNHAYGLNRGRLEDFCMRHFESCHVLRLPGLFGKGIKKNVIYDFLNNNQTQKIDSRGLFQFYNLGYICEDIKAVITKGIPLINLSVEPVSVGELIKYCFDLDFDNKVLPAPATYDFRSKYDKEWGGDSGYLYSKSQCLEDLKLFVASYQAEKK